MLTKLPCAECDSPKTELHRGDDGIRWLCRRHHQMLHVRLIYPDYEPDEWTGRFSTVIRRSMRELFYQEPNKGKLVNDLLEQHYARTMAKTRKTPTA